MKFVVTVLLVALVQYSTAESTSLPSTTGSAVEDSATTTVVPPVTTKVPESVTPTELPQSSSSSTAKELPTISTESTPDTTTAGSTDNDYIEDKSSPIPSSSTDSVPNTAVTENVTPTTSSALEEQDEPGTLEIVYHLIKHGVNFECFEKFNGDEVGRKVQDGLNVCLQSGKNLGEELRRKELERHLAAIRQIEESTFGFTTMLQMAAENMRHARILAGILVQANIQGVQNTVACVTKTLSDAHQNFGVNADTVRRCLVH